MNSLITDRWQYKAIFYAFLDGKYNSVVQKLAKKDSGKEQFSCLVILHFTTTYSLLDFLRSIFFIGTILLSS
jgi:hypothetical protein